MTKFIKIIEKYRQYSSSIANQGYKFERLMKNFLETFQLYKNLFENVWLWSDFPFKNQFGGHDVGIDLVAKTKNNEYWAVQCKCFREDAYIKKENVDSFLSTSARSFLNENGERINFIQRLWLSTTDKWSKNAEDTLDNQTPNVIKLGLDYLNSTEVDWEKLDEGISGVNAILPKKAQKSHQIQAIESAKKYFENGNTRGKLIMACGTGKTYTSLKIAEMLAKEKMLKMLDFLHTHTHTHTHTHDINNFKCLFLVPSIALITQTLREWSEQAEVPINAICICSDSNVNRLNNSKEDGDGFNIKDIGFPASTNVNSIVRNFELIRNRKKFDLKNNIENGMTVVFSTYQSIDVISEAQKELNKKYNNEYNFDLIICDEAHRTTGVILKSGVGKDESYFTKVHNNDFIIADKRIYMTATPRLYTTDAKKRAIENENIDILCSMDDEDIYGKEIYKLGFGEAIDKKLLTPYKVFVLSIKKEDVITSDIIEKIKEQNKIAKEEKNGEEIEEDDVAKLIGCINTLSKKMTDSGKYFKLLDPEPMKKAVAFCKKISISKGIEKFFNDLVDEGYYDKLFSKEEETVIVRAKHIDGGMRASDRESNLFWLKEEEKDNDKNICKVLTNVRCLSEGVDVPSLDAIMFLSAKNSEVDVVQAVGRVMRKAKNKQFGYIIIPVVIPYGEDPKKYMDKSDKFKVVWDVLNALKAHDDTFEAHINSLSINGNNESNDSGTITIYDSSGKKRNDEDKIDVIDVKKQLSLFGDLRNKFYAKLTEKFGSKKYYKIWAKDVAEIAKANINRINNILANNTKTKNEFNKFMNKLHKEINPSISEQNAIEMLSQHLITQPVFEALFENYSFSKNNPVSKSMSKILQLLEEQTSKDENERLQRFYEGVKRRVKDINTSEGKQSIIKELYENFFAVAFKEMVEKLGIVYTPIEVVDFIIHSVNDILKKEFGKSLTDKGIKIIDPFTGTGTFITRLLQSGLIKKEDLARKYKKEILANEIVLLAYYIASINIENVYHSLLDENENYKSFEGICLTDTFQLNEDTVIEEENKNMLLKTDSEENKLMLENSDRIKKQKKSKITVVIGNPPYSKGQKSANDNNQNQHYEKLEEKIKNTYVKYSKANNKNSLHDSYIKAFRWASDRIDQETGGIIGFITNNGWLDSNSADGFRYCLEKDFSSIYIFDLKGAIRGKSGEAVKKEGQNIFNIMTGVVITILVKNPKIKKEKADIYYYCVDDYSSRKEKLSILKTFHSIDFVVCKNLKSDKYNDWFNKRSELFNSFIPINTEEKYNTNKKSYFVNYSCGIASSRDVWVYNFSKNELKKNINITIEHYNKEMRKFSVIYDEINKDSKKCNWTDTWDSFLKRNIEIKEDESSYYEGIYRPFCKENIYYDRYLNERVYQMLSIFPHRDAKNLCICVSGLSSSKNFSCLIVNNVADACILNGKTQCFPLNYYTKKEQSSLFGDEDDYIKHDGISDFILKRCQENYKTKDITKEDIFYYVYGFLHNENYRNKFQADLKKMLPRIPLVDSFEDFNKISNIGRQLAELHLNYEAVPANKDCKVVGRESNDFCVKKMSFGKNGKDKDKSVIIYNSSIRIENIPQKAYEYVVNGKSAIEWIMDKYQVTQDKNSGLTNDPNDWGREHGRPSYILDLLLSVVEVSVRTVGLVKEVSGIDVNFKK